MVVYLTSNETFPIPTTYLAVYDIQCKQAARQRRTSFSTIFLILKRRGGVWPNKEKRHAREQGHWALFFHCWSRGTFIEVTQPHGPTINQLGPKLVRHILWWDTRYFLGLHLELVAARCSAYRVLPSYWTFIKMIKAKKLLFVSLADSNSQLSRLLHHVILLKAANILSRSKCYFDVLC